MTIAAPATHLRRVAWTHTVAGEKRIGYTEELLALPDDTDLYMIAEPTEQPRDIKAIKADIALAREHLQQLGNELEAAQLRKFLKKHGIPEGAEPILQDAAGARFLVTGHNGTFATGLPFKKDGSPANTPRHLFNDDKLHYVEPT